MFSKESFVGLIKGYTSDAAYVLIGEKMRKTQFSPIIGFVSTIMQGINLHCIKYSYRAVHFPVWRGLSAHYVNMSDYQLGKIGYWPTFASTSKCKKQAIGFMNLEKNKTGVLMKIYLS